MYSFIIIPKVEAPLSTLTIIIEGKFSPQNIFICHLEIMMFIEREVEAFFKFMSFHFGRMNIAQKFLQEEGKM